jgi:hypothetical protein
MKHVLLITAMAMSLALPAMAQSNRDDPAEAGGSPGSVTPSPKTNHAGPVAGHNSFTEGEARSRIEKAGYSNVSGLNQDSGGIWRGSATKDGAKHSVSLDYQGNVNG